MTAQRDDAYFFGPLVTFQVEDTIFKVLRREFEVESEVLARMLATPPNGADGDGRDEKHPLRLEGITASEFRSFLKALFPRRGLSSTQACTDQELDAALRLARMWCFKDLEKVLIQDLESLNLPSARKLELARTHDIRKWYKPELRLLAQRSSGLTPEEVTQLGPALTSIVCELCNHKYTSLLRCYIGAREKNTTWITVSEIESEKKGSIQAAVDRRLDGFIKDHCWEEPC